MSEQGDAQVSLLFLPRVSALWGAAGAQRAFPNGNPVGGDDNPPFEGSYHPIGQRPGRSPNPLRAARPLQSAGIRPILDRAGPQHPHIECAEDALDDWLVESNGLGGLNVFCPGCWQREFGGSGALR